MMRDQEAMIRRHVESLMAGDVEGAMEGLSDDFVQDWPQSGERLHGRVACAMVYRNYPGGSPTGTVRRVVGRGDVQVAESLVEYGGTPTFVVSVFEFRDGLIVHETDWFTERFPAPAWRSDWVELVG